MKIEAGRYYRTRDGQKVGPIRFEHGKFDAPFPTGNPTVSWVVEYRRGREDDPAEPERSRSRRGMD